MKKGKVWLIGAGCGRADLITVRGLEALRKADAVVYDDLIDPALLAECPGERIYMGKRNGRHSSPQDEISERLAELAGSGKTVARLKGGDPFVFGRGGEEALLLMERGIPFEEVPGISSSIAIPASAGIPVTHRKMSRGFMVVTGHTADGSGIPEDIREMASFSGTLVILMGLTRIREITDALMAEGKDPGTPSAVISGGNAPHPKTVRGKLSDIADITARENVLPPAVIVIGRTAGLDLRSICGGDLPLRGTRVGITGTPAFASKLERAFAERGAETVRCAESTVAPLPFSAGRILDGTRKWLVFTSSNGVRTFFSRVKEEGIDMRRFSSASFAVIGRPTGETLMEHGFAADLVPETFTSRSLALLLAERAGRDEEMVLLRADNASDVLPSMLRESGFRVEDTKIYSVAPGERDDAAQEGLDYITFSSSCGIRTYMETYGHLPEGAVPVAIGEITAAETERLTGISPLTAARAEAEAVAETVSEDRNKGNSGL